MLLQKSIDTSPERIDALQNEFAFPIDVVYTWVDGNDPQHQKLLSQIKEGKYKEYCRFVTNNEIYYSLYSLYKFAPWVRRIFIVTADYQEPNLQGLPQLVLDKITLIKHSQIMPQSALPTFNSMAIESRICYINDLSEHFIYFNDDVFLGNFVNPNNFFNENGAGYFFQKKIPEFIFKPIQIISPHAEVFQNTITIFEKLTNKKMKLRRWHGVHQSFPSLKSILLEFCENELIKNTMDELLHSKLRCYKHPGVFYLMYLIGLQTDKIQIKSLPSTAHYFYNFKDYDCFFWLKLYLLKVKQPPFFCINNDLKLTQNTYTEKIFRNFLYEYFDKLIPPPNVQ